MVDLALLQSVSYIAGALGVCVAASYYVMTLRVQQNNMKTTLETRQAQILITMLQTIQSPQYRNAKKILEPIQLKNSEDYNKMTSNQESNDAFFIVAWFLEGVGVLVRENLISERLVAELISGEILDWWKRYGGIVKEMQLKMGFPRFCVEVEYLNSRMIDFASKHPELGIKIPGFYGSGPLVGPNDV
jgi:hypothetical protein